MSRVEKLIIDIVSAYIDEQKVEVNSLDIADIVEICQQVDKSLKRMKRRVVEDAAEKAFAKLQSKYKKSSSNTQPESDDEGASKSGLMTVSEAISNSMNKSITDLWAPSPAGASRRKKRRVAAAERRPATNISLADLGGIDPIIEQILELLAMPLSHPEVYIQLGSDIPRGILLHGPPGCGKTALANAIANELNVPFINVSAPTVVSGMSGESEKKLREIFEEAESLAPCLVFIDEIDAITPKRDNVQREMERRIVAQLLTCMDDVSLEKTGGKPVMVIGATNRPDAIDPALRRGGRFDHEICMPVPDQEARRRILEALTKKLRLDGNFDFDSLAKATPGYVGADMNALVSAAGLFAIKRIFSKLSKCPDDVMDLETDEPDISSNDTLVSRFLKRYPNPLTPEQLSTLAITFEDFLHAIPTIQPSSKREGFATVPDVTWEDVGAMTSIREELEYAIVEPIRRPEVYKAAGITAPSGVLLWGPPGCGKTLLAKAVANESQANFISIRGPELLNKYVGESERAVRQVFLRARASVPCIIFFDELDALVPRRDDSNSEASSRVVNTLLTELDGVGDRNGVFVVAATNRPDMIDAAMLRPGRLDKQLFVELPTPDERAEILKTVSRSSPMDASIDVVALAHDERCRNFSGADLAALVREASVLALKAILKNNAESSVKVDNSHFEQAFKKVRPSVTDAERRKYAQMREKLST